MNISNNEIKDIFLNLHETLRSLHSKKVIIGDFNDLMLAGTLAGVEMGLEIAGVPHRKGGVLAAK